MADSQECQHEWRHTMTTRQADYHAGKRISRVYEVRTEDCALCGAHREEVLPAPPLVCPSCGGSGYVRSRYSWTDAWGIDRAIEQTEPCWDCRAR